MQDSQERNILEHVAAGNGWYPDVLFWIASNAGRPVRLRLAIAMLVTPALINIGIAQLSAGIFLPQAYYGVWLATLLFLGMLLTIVPVCILALAMVGQPRGIDVGLAIRSLAKKAALQTIGILLAWWVSSGGILYLGFVSLESKFEAVRSAAQSGQMDAAEFLLLRPFEVVRVQAESETGIILLYTSSGSLPSSGSGFLWSPTGDLPSFNIGNSGRLSDHWWWFTTD